MKNLPKRGWKNYWRRGVGVALLLLLGVGVLWFGLSAAPRPKVQLSDGTTLEFVGAGFGKMHGYPPQHQSFWQKVPFASYFGYRGGYMVGKDSVFFWYRQLGKASQLLALQRVVVDENGAESSVIDYGCAWDAPDGARVEGCGGTVWPRQSRKIGLRFYAIRGTNAPEKVAEFWTRNPGQFSQPPKQPLAAKKTSGDLEVSLKSVEFGPLPEGAPPTAWGPAHAWPFLRLAVLWQGKPTTAWRIVRNSLEDATGNTLDLWNDSFSCGKEEILPLCQFIKDGERSAAMPRCLWPREDACKVTVTLAPRANAEFQPRELAVFRGIPVPSSGEAKDLGISTNINGLAIDLEMIHGSAHDPTGRDRNYRGDTVLAIHYIDPARQLTLVKVVDDQGRAVPVGRPDAYDREISPGRYWPMLGFGLKIEPGAKTLDVTLGVTTNRTAEFLVAPSRLPIAAGVK